MASTDYKVTNNGAIYGYDLITKGPWVDARANGITSTEMYALIASLAAYNVVIFPPGTTTLTATNTGVDNDATIFIPKSNTVYMGWGKGITTLKVASGLGPTVKWNIFHTDAKLENCIFANMTLDGNGANNLVGGGDPARSHRFISATGGGKNIEICNIEFTGGPGNNCLAFSATADCGNIRIHDCDFTEMGSGITGNVCADHTDMYLLGHRNKVYRNYFKSTNKVTGQMIEFHGSLGEAFDNYGKDYHVAVYLSNEEEILTLTTIRDNVFETVYYPLRFSSAGAYSVGEVVFRNNHASVHASATPNDSFIYGPDDVDGVCDMLKIENNTLIGNAGITFHAISPVYTKDLFVSNNLIKGFSRGITFSSTALLGDGYGHHRIDILGNKFYNHVSVPIYAATGGKVKVLNIKNNNIYADAATGQTAISLDCDPDGGEIIGNTIDGNYTYDLSLGSTMDTIQLNHFLGSVSGIDASKDYCSKGSMLQRIASAIIKYKFGAGLGDWKSVDYST